MLPLPPPPPRSARTSLPGKGQSCRRAQAPSHPLLSSASFPRGNFSAIRKLHPTNRDQVTRAAQCTLLKGRRGDFLAEWKRGRHKLRAGMEQREKEREERAILKRGKRWSGNGSFGPTFAGRAALHEGRAAEHFRSLKLSSQQRRWQRPPPPTHHQSVHGARPRVHPR